MFRSLSLAIAAFASVASAQAQRIPDLTLAPGEAVTIQFDEAGAAGAPVRSPARWSSFDVEVARQMSGMTPPDAPQADAIPLDAITSGRPEPIPSNLIRVRLLSIAGRHAMLVVENGQGRALAYRARMTADGQTRSTDVCTVLPRLPGYEHWPHPVERIVLSDFRLIPWAPGRAPVCE